MTNYIAKIFGSSPVKPLQEHIAKACECAEQLPEFFAAVVREDWDAVAAQRARITDLEHEADALKKELRLHLPSSLMMPVARGDLLSVLRMQDNVANRAKDIAGLVVGRRIRLPAPIAEPFLALVNRSIDAARQANKTVGELDELFETGFRGREVEVMQSMITRLDEIENDTDQLQIKVRAVLFGIENELPPVEVMFLYKIIDLAGDLADTAQRVGSRLQLLLAR